MRVLDRLHGHEPTLEGLWRAAASQRLPHAISFEGPSGIGKFNAALRLANGLLCGRGPGAPCGECAPCKRVRSGGRRGNHPDLYLVDSVEEAREQQSSSKVLSLDIKLARIAVRDGEEDCAEGFLRLVSAEGGWRIVIIREAHRMLTEAQNALLKTLEEPGKQTLLILESAQSGELLPTIRSRLVRIRFERLDPQDTEAILRAEEVDPNTAPILAAWSDGAPGEGLRLAREGAVQMRALFLSVLSGTTPPLDAAGQLWKLPGEFIGSSPKARDRHRARVAIDVLLDLLGDTMRLEEGAAPETLRHRDLALSGALKPKTLVGTPIQIERCLDLRAAMSGNISAEATIERCLLSLDLSQP